jgi:hypothetical protein
MGMKSLSSLYTSGTTTWKEPICRNALRAVVTPREERFFLQGILRREGAAITTSLDNDMDDGEKASYSLARSASASTLNRL